MWKCSFEVFFSLLCFKGFVLKYLGSYLHEAGQVARRSEGLGLALGINSVCLLFFVRLVVLDIEF